jgi:UDP-N-acetyl-D-mannosaminuronic acid transferase (WecB/TagA/CpsF family)
MHDLRVTEAGMASPLPHVDFLGLPFCPLSEQQVVQLIIESCGLPFRYVVTPNAYNVVAAHDEPSLLSI